MAVSLAVWLADGAGNLKANSSSGIIAVLGQRHVSGMYIPTTVVGRTLSNSNPASSPTFYGCNRDV